jgi:hypothetical protein
VNRPQQPKPAVKKCNSCTSVNCAPHCKSTRCAWWTCNQCGRVSDNFHHHIEKRPIA